MLHGVGVWRRKMHTYAKRNLNVRVCVTVCVCVCVCVCVYVCACAVSVSGMGEGGEWGAEGSSSLLIDELLPHNVIVRYPGHNSFGNFVSDPKGPSLSLLSVCVCVGGCVVVCPNHDCRHLPMWKWISKPAERFFVQLSSFKPNIFKQFSLNIC